MGLFLLTNTKNSFICKPLKINDLHWGPHRCNLLIINRLRKQGPQRKFLIINDLQIINYIVRFFLYILLLICMYIFSVLYLVIYITCLFVSYLALFYLQSNSVYLVCNRQILCVIWPRIIYNQTKKPTGCPVGCVSYREYLLLPSASLSILCFA